MRRRWCLPMLAAWVAWLPVAACAAALGIAPVRIDLHSERRIGTVTVRNDDPRPVMIQVRTYAWPRTSATADLEPTRELLAVPAISTIAPGQQQVVRVALRGPMEGDREVAYRVVIAEIPSTAGSGDAGVRFALAFSLPVFATPPDAVPDPQWSIDADATPAMLRLVNDGNAHLQVRRIRLRDAGGAQAIELPAYVLAGQAYAWPLTPRPRGTISLKAETDRGEIEATLATPGR